MAYLAHYPHAAFVSYAHSALNGWSAGFVEHLQQAVALGLKLKTAELPFFFDTQTEGNVGLTDSLKRSVEKAACLIVLLTDEFLDSHWCTKELGWFDATIAAKRHLSSEPVFIVRLHEVPRTNWPKGLRELDVTGYHFEGDRVLRTPVGHSIIGPPQGPIYEEALRKVAGAMITHLKKLRGVEIEQREETEAPAPGPLHPEKVKPRLFLTAVPEDLKRLRAQAAELLTAEYDVVPRDNPRDPRAIRDNIGTWLDGAQHCVALLGSLAGDWDEDDEGSVLFQLRAANTRRIATSRYVKCGLILEEVECGAYKTALEALCPFETAELTTFIEGLGKACCAPEPRSSAASIYLIRDEDDQLEGTIRNLLASANVLVQPLQYEDDTARDLRVLYRDEDLTTFLETSNAVLVLNGQSKRADRLRVSKVSQNVHVRYSAIGRRPVIGIVDGPTEPRLKPTQHPPQPRVFKGESPDLLAQILSWLDGAPRAAQVIS